MKSGWHRSGKFVLYNFPSHADDNARTVVDEQFGCRASLQEFVQASQLCRASDHQHCLCILRSTIAAILPGVSSTMFYHFTLCVPDRYSKLLSQSFASFNSLSVTCILIFLAHCCSLSGPLHSGHYKSYIL